MIDIVSPAPVPEERMMSGERAQFDAAAQAYSEADNHVLNAETLDVLEAIVPSLNKVGWVIIRNGLDANYVASLEVLRPEVERPGADTTSAMRKAQHAATPAMVLFSNISTIGLHDAGPTDQHQPRYRMAPIWIGSVLRHADYRYSHGFLGNPLVHRGAQVTYGLGGPEDVVFNEAFTYRQETVDGTDLLLLAAEAVPMSNEEAAKAPELIQDGRQHYRTVAHEIVGASSTDRRLRMFSDVILEHSGTIPLPAVVSALA